MQGQAQPIPAAAYPSGAQVPGINGQANIGTSGVPPATPAGYQYQITPQMVQSSSASPVGYSQAAVAYANQATASQHQSYQSDSSKRYPMHYGKK